MFLVGCQSELNKTSSKNSETAPNVQQLVYANHLKREAKTLRYFYNGKPFTGRAVQYHTQEQLSEESHYKNGLRHGRQRTWLKNGDLSYEGLYKDGEKDGTQRSWWENSNKRSEIEYKEGVINGEENQWHKDGTRFKAFNYKNGEEEGLQQSWLGDGTKYNNYEVKNGRVYGLKRAAVCLDEKGQLVPNTID